MDVCITLDLEPDHAGRLAPEHTAWEQERVARLTNVLGTHGAPLTVFVVASSLGAAPKVIEAFDRYGADFQLHSHSHDLAQPDSEEEISRGQDAFTAFFGRRAEGYRAPEGRISADGLRRLDAAGFLYDSSVFPSFWPRPRYFGFPRRPYRPTGHALVEIPIGTVTPLRIIVSLSWMKLLGWRTFRHLLRFPLPDPLVFDMHLHDLAPVSSVQRLPVHWRALYGRNADQGFPILESFMALLRARGCRFTTVGAIARATAIRC